MHFTAWFIPASLREGPIEDRRRAVVIMWFWLAVVLWSPIYAIIYFRLGRPEFVAVIALATVLALAVPVSLQRTKSIWVAGNLFTIVLVSLMIVLTLLGGGLNFPGRAWFVLIPPLAVAMSGTGSTVFWTLVVTAFNVGLYVMHLQGIEFDRRFTAAEAGFLDMIATSTLLILTGTLTLAYERSQRRTVQMVRERADALSAALTENERVAQRLKKANQALADDVRKRKLVEKTLRDSKHLLANVISTIPYFVFWKDREFRYLGCNQRFTELVGLADPGAIVGKSDYDLLWKKDNSDWIRKCDQQVIASGVPMLNFEETVQHADGSETVLLTSKVPLRDSQGQVIGVLGCFADITARKQLEQQLRLQSSALRAAGSAIVITDTQGAIEWVNPAFTRMTGYTLAEVLGRNPSILKSGEQDAQFYNRLWQEIISGRTWHGEILNRRKDGTLYPEEMTITPVRDDAGAITHFIALKQDITDRKRAERLASERDQLREAVKAHEHVLGVVGHELRTPLAGLMIATEFLLNEKMRDSPEVDVFLQSINSEIQRMSTMVNDMLEVARLNSGIAKWQWGEFALRDACAEAVSSIERLIDPARVQLKVRIDPPDITMRGDASAVRRLILNLLSNACKHTKYGRISVETRQISQDGLPFVEICVRDTGTGMTEETAARLGEAFALNSGVIGEKYVSGSGLGLAICRGIVQAHAGTIAVSSKLNSGTTCTVRLRPDLPGPHLSDQPVAIISESQV